MVGSFPFHKSYLPFFGQVFGSIVSEANVRQFTIPQEVRFSAEECASFQHRDAFYSVERSLYDLTTFLQKFAEDCFRWPERSPFQVSGGVSQYHSISGVC